MERAGRPWGAGVEWHCERGGVGVHKGGQMAGVEYGECAVIESCLGAAWRSGRRSGRVRRGRIVCGEGSIT